MISRSYEALKISVRGVWEYTALLRVAGSLWSRDLVEVVVNSFTTYEAGAGVALGHKAARTSIKGIHR